ncbi:MAG: hypothetical protein ABIN01_13225 [Ferruginibacter sp.]
MKKVILSIVTLSIFAFSCQKNDSAAPPSSTEKYMSLTVGSTWNYELINNTAPIGTSTFTLTSSGKDSTINGKTYHVFTNSSGTANEYFNISGNDYYTFRSLPPALGTTSVEYLYLKDNAAAGTSWSQSFPITLSGVALNANLINTITQKGLTKIVKGVTYNDVIHVTTTVSATFMGIPLPASAIQTDIQSFYAGKYGMVQSINKINVNYAGITNNSDQQTNLNTANIK